MTCNYLLNPRREGWRVGHLPVSAAPKRLRLAVGHETPSARTVLSATGITSGVRWLHSRLSRPTQIPTTLGFSLCVTRRKPKKLASRFSSL